MKLNLNLKNLRRVLLRMLSLVEQVKRFPRKFLKSGKKWTLSRIKRFINIVFRILLLETDWLTKRKFLRKKSSWQMDFI